MEKLLKNKWLMLLIGAVVLYFVWKKFGKGENTAGAYGSNYGLSPLYATGKMRSRRIRPGGSARKPIGCQKPTCQECSSPCPDIDDAFCQGYGFAGAYDGGGFDNGGCYGGSPMSSFPGGTTRVLRSR
jgi:hypothetical protein